MKKVDEPLLKNQYPKKRKEINPKNQKKKQFEIKKKGKKEKYYPPKIGKINKKKENIQNENQEKSESQGEKQENQNISKVSNNEIRYFGKEIKNPSLLDERINQYILSGNSFKKYKNSIPNSNITQITDINEETFKLIDAKFLNNPQYVIQYRNDIFQNLIKEENKNMPNYGEINDIVDAEIRNRYIVYLISVCDRITKKEEIHYLSINIFDRVICHLVYDKENLTEKKLQLICFTSLFIAYKYETGCYFLIDDLINHTDDSLVTSDEVLNYENEINKILNFEYLIVYPSHFIRHYEIVDDINDQKLYFFCLYLIDFILTDYELMKNKKSLISASCYYIAKANLLKINNWPNIFQFLTGYSKNEIKDIAVKIVKALKNSKDSAIFKCLKKKYSKEGYYKVIDYIIGRP